MKLIRSNDSTASTDAKSSNISHGGGGGITSADFIADGGGGGGGNSRIDLEKMYGNTSGKRDDLTVNPILGHHRLCDRTQQKLEAACVELQIENEITLARQNRADHKSSSASAALQFHQTPPTTKHTLVDLSDTKMDARNSGDHKMGNLIKTTTTTMTNTDTATGSTNSLWSKTSSNATNKTNNNAPSAGAVGAKMFETFNRNLIKSIKVCSSVSRKRHLKCMHACI